MAETILTDAQVLGPIAPALLTDAEVLGPEPYNESGARALARLNKAISAGMAVVNSRPLPGDPAAGPSSGRLSSPGEQNGLLDSLIGGGKGQAMDPAELRALKDAIGDFAEEDTTPFGLGFQHSVTGLIGRGKLPNDPEKDLFADDPGRANSTFQRVMFQLGNLAGDLPFMAVGGLIGTAGGPADPITVPAAAFALPAGMRQVLMDAYAKGSVTSWRDFFERSVAVTWETVKAGVTGAAVGRAGAVAPLAAQFPAQVATMVGVGAALEGRVPEPEEFLDAAIVIGGLHAAATMVPKLQAIYAKTGRRPADVARDAESDPQIRAEVSVEGPGLPEAYRAVAARQAQSRSHILDNAIEGLRSALDDPAKLDALRAELPEIKGPGQVSAMLDDLLAERARMRALEPPAPPEPKGNALPPALRPPKDETFGQWVRRQGGISSDEKFIGSVRSTYEGKARTLIRKDGLDLDTLGERAFEDGWFRERPTIGQVLDLLHEDSRGTTYHPSSVAHETLAFQAALDRELTEMGVEARGLTDDQMYAALENARREHLRNMDEAAKGDYHAERYGVLDADLGRLEGDYGKAITKGEFDRRDAEISAARGSGHPDRPPAGGPEVAGQSAAAAATAPHGPDAGSGVEPAGVGFRPDRGEAARGRVGLDPGLTEPRLQPGVNESVVGAAEELLLAGRVVRDDSRLISDQIMELLQTARIRPGQYQEILDRHGVSADDFAQLWRADTRKAAQHLQRLSALAADARVRQFAGTASEHDLAILREQGIDADAHVKGLWRRLDDLRRASLVTQLATAVRNFETQVGRVGLDVLQRGLDAAIQRAFPEARRTAHAADVFEVVLRAFSPRETKGLADAVLARFPKEADDLFMRFSSDLTRAGLASDLMGKAERAVWFLNGMNRFQEFAVRRPVFVAELDRILAARGESLERIVAENRVGVIERDEIKAAVEKALEMTFAEDFSPHSKKWSERVAGKFIGIVNDFPGVATLPFPFPRFLMNAVKFQYEFSPLGFLKLTSAEERAAIAKGDTSAISRAAIGTAMLGAAWAIRNSEWAGEKWWELKLPSGETVSLLPFNPFVFHLFAADLAKRLKDGTIASLTTKDLAFGFLSSNFRAGAGLFLLDKIIEGFTGLGDADKAIDRLKELAGETASGFLVPLQTLADFYAEFDTWLGSGQEAVIRDRRAEPFLGPLKANVPILKQTLPAAASPTREAPMRRLLPAVRQLTGAGLRAAKNPAESELDRLGFTRAEIAPSTGDRAADQAIAKFMGPLVEAVVVPLVQTPFYQGESNEVKGGLLRLTMHGVRLAAVAQAKAADPERFLKISVDTMSKRERLMLESLTGQPLDTLFGIAPAPEGK